MTLPRQLLQIDYDQFHRYAAVTVLLKPLLEAWHAQGKILRILEVGSHALNLLPAFLSPIPVEIVRADLEPMYAGDVGPYVTIHKDKPLPFADNSFDMTVAMEVLEHIPAEQRQRAMSEWKRVASKGILFTCPNGDEVIAQEQRADADFQARHGRVHPWLIEHECYGRPTQEQVRELCRTLGLTCHHFYNSPLAEWLPLLLATEQIFEKGDRALLSRFNAMLNTRPFRPFIQEPGYRCIYGGFKTTEVDEQARHHWHGVAASRVSEATIDPVRMLANRLSQFILEHRQREVDGTRLVAMEAENQALKQKLQSAEQRLVCTRWQAAQTRSWWQRWQLHQSNDEARTVLVRAMLHDVENLGNQCWQVSGSQPRFEWECHHQRGWHRIEIMGQASEGEAVRLDLDYGHGFSEQHVVRLGVWKSEATHLGVNAYFHHAVKRLRLVPCQSQKPLVLDALSIKPVTSFSVALQGIGRLLGDLVRFPRWTWQAIRQSRSVLRLGMQMTMTPVGLPMGADTEYHRWLMEQLPSRRERDRLIEQHRTNPDKVVVVLRLLPTDTPESIATTVQSLSQQDACRWELWCAAGDEQRAVVETGRREAFTVSWMEDRPDRGYAGLLNECAAVSQATWLFQLRAGDVLEPNACLQILQAAKNHPAAALIYADEDQLLHFEGPARPVFKAGLTPLTLREEPTRLGEAVAFHGPTLLRLGGFHPCYEGALTAQYLYRLLDKQEHVVHLQRVLLHQQPRPETGRAVQSVLERLREEHGVNEYDVRFSRVPVPPACPERFSQQETEPVLQEGTSC